MILVSLDLSQYCYFIDHFISLIPGPVTSDWHGVLDAITCTVPSPFAYTLVPPEAQHQASSIIFCPWFLHNERRKEYGFVAESLLEKIYEFLANAKFATFSWWYQTYAQIDMLHLFDATIIHEVGRALPGRKTLSSNRYCLVDPYSAWRHDCRCAIRFVARPRFEDEQCGK